MFIQSVLFLVFCVASTQSMDNFGTPTDRGRPSRIPINIDPRIDKIDRWNTLYRMIALPGPTNLTLEQAHTLLLEMHLLEVTPDFFGLLQMKGPDYRGKIEFLRSFATMNEYLIVTGKAICPRGSSFTEQLLKLFEYAEASCIPDDLKKVLTMVNMAQKESPLKLLVDHLVQNHFLNCWERYKNNLMAGQALLSKDEITMLILMSVQVRNARPDLRSMVLSQESNPEAMLVQKMIYGLSRYCLHIAPQTVTIPLVQGASSSSSPNDMFDRTFEEHIWRPCYRVCVLNEYPYKYWPEFNALYQASSAPPQVDPDLLNWSATIEMCCIMGKQNIVKFKSEMRRQVRSFMDAPQYSTSQAQGQSSGGHQPETLNLLGNREERPDTDPGPSSYH